MLLALAPAAETAAVVDTAYGKPQYVANQVIPKSITLSAKDVCTKDGYIDPPKLAVQVMVQLQMFDELAAPGAAASLKTLDGRDCAHHEADAENAPDVDTKASRCTAAIFFQRLLLNVYPGFRPTREEALKYFKDEPGAPAEAVLSKDVDGLTPDERRQVLNFAMAFVQSGSGGHFVRCDYVDASAQTASATPQMKTLREPDPGALSRSTAGAQLAIDANSAVNILKRLQWRSIPGNLIYRAPANSTDKYTADFAVSQDLYNADKGFGFDLVHVLALNDKKQGQRDYKPDIEGAIGLPFCGLVKGRECQLATPQQFKNLPKFQFDVTPYLAWERKSDKKTIIGTPDVTSTSTSFDQFEYGAVAFLHSDETNQGCAILRKEATSCATYYVARLYGLEDHFNHSRQTALAVRYIPMLKTAREGLRQLDWCFNAVCGDTDRDFRLGILADLRGDFGSYARRGVASDVVTINRDYARVGGRLGLLGVVSLVPGSPISLWGAYTRLYPLSGYRNDLGEVQTQASMSFGAATVSLSWRNGRREDTAQRDSTWEVKVGFKPPS